MSTVIFWLVFATVSGWALKRWYFPHNRALVEEIRTIVVVIEFATLGLFFFPWLPLSHGGDSGWELMLGGGEVGMSILGALLLFVLGIFLGFPKPLFLKAGALAHGIATVVLFVTMIRMMPGTVQLEFRDVAPIIAALLMLTNTAVVLFLWHQLQKRDKLNM